MEAFGDEVEYDMCPMMAGAGKVFLAEAFNSSLAPAPISPFTVEHPAWRLLAGTSRGIYASRPNAEEELDAPEELYMAPFYSTGNTDTKRYWALTRNIYRFSYLSEKSDSHAHTVDENVVSVCSVKMGWTD